MNQFRHMRQNHLPAGHTIPGVRNMSKRKTKRSSQQMGENLRLNPQLRLCPKFDPDSIAEFHVGEPGEMGVRVVDNCAEEHIM